jgi:hypothetical protein
VPEQIQISHISSDNLHNVSDFYPAVHRGKQENIAALPAQRTRNNRRGPVMWGNVAGNDGATKSQIRTGVCEKWTDRGMFSVTLSNQTNIKQHRENQYWAGFWLDCVCCSGLICMHAIDNCKRSYREEFSTPRPNQSGLSPSKIPKQPSESDRLCI